MKNEVIILVGVSGSGKTTWSTNYMKSFKNTLRINRDSIRQMLVGNLDGYYKRKDLDIIEMEVTCAEIDIADNLVLNAYDIILDNTNLKPSHIDRWCNYFEKRGYSIKFKFFDIESIAYCKKMVNQRDNLTYTQLDYIDKQFQQYQNIKNYIETKYKDNIL